MRSSRAPTSLGQDCMPVPPPTPRSMRRAMARAIGVPMTVIGIMMNITIGMSSPGIRTDCLRGVDACCGQRESDLGAAPNRARGVHRSVVGEDRLTSDREPEPRATWLGGDVGLPDPGHPLGRNPAARVANRDDDRVVSVLPIASHSED